MSQTSGPLELGPTGLVQGPARERENVVEQTPQESEVLQKSLPADITVAQSLDGNGEADLTGADAVPERRRFQTIPEIEGVASGHFRPLAEWLGWVTSVENGGFTAEVQTKADPGRREVVEFDIEDVSTYERDSVREGAYFYWSVGYLTQPSGQVSRTSLLRFRRLPEWPADALARARSRAEQVIKQIEDA